MSMAMRGKGGGGEWLCVCVGVGGGGGENTAELLSFTWFIVISVNVININDAHYIDY